MSKVDLLSKTEDYVVVLHGLGKNPSIMRNLSNTLIHLNYDVYADYYQSTHHSISRLADHVYQRIRHHCPDHTKPIHFVSHSLGGIITRIIIARYRPANLGRVVMIAPPNKGTEVVDFLKRFKLFYKVFGPAGQQLGTQEGAIHKELPDVDYELGIIAGNRSSDPWFSWFVLPGASDGKVSVESTKLEGMKDHIIVPSTHAYIPKKRITAYQTAYFLRHGRFDHDKKNMRFHVRSK